MALEKSVFSAIFIALLAYYYPEILDSPKDTETVMSEYDFIIVGAGSAGSVVASRLSEIENWSVAVFEAGENETPFSKTPTLMYSIRPSLVWNYPTVKQEHACYNSSGFCMYTSGKVLGGTSSINGMIYTRGSKTIYDSWEKKGLPGWGYRDVLPYFLKSEDIQEKELFSSPYHKRGGPLSVQYPRYKPPIVDDFVSAAKDIGLDERDYNGEYQCCVSRPQMTVKGAQRWSTSSAFLQTQSKKRSNLSIVKKAHVVRLILDQSKKSVVGIEYKKDNKTHVVRARKEVILSAGPFNSPKLLMLAGIGPKRHLEDVGIPVVADLPVGQNFEDHPLTLFTVAFNDSGKLLSDPLTVDSMLDFAVKKNGPLTNLIPTIIFANSGANITQEPANIQIYLIPSPESKSFTVMYIGTNLLLSDSTGTVKLRSSNPEDPLLVDPRFFSSGDDEKKMLKGLQIVLKLLRSQSMKKYSPEIYTEGIPFCKQNTYDEMKLLKCIIKYYSYTSYHQVGTVKMGNISDTEAVLGPDLKVKGIDKLRVIDSSIMPSIPNGNTNAPTIMIAEKASDIIKKYHLQ